MRVIKVRAKLSDAASEKTHYSSTTSIHHRENHEEGRGVNVNLIGIGPGVGRRPVRVADNECRSSKYHHPYERSCRSDPDQSSIMSGIPP